MQESTIIMDQQSPNPPLKRELGLLEVTLSGVGIILGAYTKGKFPGLISVIIAYIAGVLLIVSTATALVLPGIAIFIGYLVAGR